MEENDKKNSVVYIGTKKGKNADNLASEMFQRVDKKLKKTYTTGMRSLIRMDNEEEKKKERKKIDRS